MRSPASNSLEPKRPMRLFHTRGDNLYCVLRMGLGNRIHHLAASMRIAEHLGLGLRAYWETESMGASWREILRPIPGVTLVDLRWHHRTAQGLLPGAWLWLEGNEVPDASKSSYPDPEIPGYVMGVKRPGFQFYSAPSWVSEHLKSCYRPYFDRIRFVDTVEDEVSAYLKSIGDIGLGIHLRGTDMLPKISKAKLDSTHDILRISKFVSQEVEDLEGCVFLATDEPMYVQALNEVLGDRLCTRFQSGPARGERGDAHNAAVDMGILARSNRLHLSISSFGASAWWLGDCPPAIRYEEVLE